MYISIGSQRAKYYLAWILAEAASNASGLGFNGYDEANGKAKWDLLTNINILALETSTSMKTIFDNWNIQTQIWLKRICYDRISTNNGNVKLFAVFVLSAVWHGFYSGYYMTAALAVLAVQAGRKVNDLI